MAIDNDKTAGKDFNTLGTTEIFRRIKGYKLNELETNEIGNLYTECSKGIHQENQEFGKAGEFNKRREAEYEKLAKEEQRSPQRHLTPDGARTESTRHELRRKAGDNVQKQHRQRLDNFVKDRDKQVNAMLDKARDEGRGPDRDQSQDRSQDHQRDHDRR